ncbi:phosphonate ABC transporter, permease protein PhnE [Niallia nealsonii]|uniref:Phosphonate ABC transporter, permease protein PhnE n=1 Tax=Niallia nealsonii TaxID=115979 RepID=A0A2N0Z164_9BACI|nr:phosphonate ABC transporter, permease protein PhnE [Niallia nealsonii]PKG23254.1 phosphonate ABC transporter, permease protein PhnE [Niallia nealsonii]
MKETNKSKMEAPKPPAKTKHIFTTILVLLLLWWSGFKTESSFADLVYGFPNMFDLLVQMWPPNWNYFERIIEPMLETIRMAVVGTTFGAIIAVPLALLCANNIIRIPIIFYPFRFILNLIRTIPDLLLASIFVAIFGLGALPGMLALSIFSIGLIAKLLYEAIEAIDPGPLEAMTAVGANKVQWIFFGVIPQITAHFTSYFLYTFEVNIRAAAILGLVGAGGIGEYYDKTLGFLEYDKTASIILFTLIVVLIIDSISTKLREKLL